MDFFDRHKALIITFLIFGILILGLYNFNLSNSNQKAREFLVDLDNYRLEEQAEKEPEAEEVEQQSQTQPSRQTHRAFNEEQEARSENFDRQLDEILDRNSANKEEASENEAESSTGDYNIANTPQKKAQQRSDGDNTSNQTATQNSGIDNSSISFSLLGRTAVHIPNPVYTCDRAGKIVINITVNSQGRVTSTSLNKGSSTSSNECLTENALQYAAGAVFSQLPGRDSQPGTITFYFQP